MISPSSSASVRVKFLARNVLHDCWHPDPKSRRNFARAAGPAAAAHTPRLVSVSYKVARANTDRDDWPGYFKRQKKGKIPRPPPKKVRAPQMPPTPQWGAPPPEKTADALLAHHRFV